MALKIGSARAFVTALHEQGIHRYEDLGQHTVDSLVAALASSGSKPKAVRPDLTRRFTQRLFDRAKDGAVGKIDGADLAGMIELPGDSDSGGRRRRPPRHRLPGESDSPGRRK